MICPLMKGREKTSCWGECERTHCALWDIERDQCAVKTFLTPPKPSKIEDTELNDLQILNNKIDNLTAATQRIAASCQRYVDKEIIS